MDFAVSFPLEAGKKFVKDERLVFGEEMVCKCAAASCFEAIHTHQMQARSIDVERLEIQIVHADKFEALVGKRDEFLPFVLRAPLLGHVHDRAQDADALVGLDRI